MSTTSGHVFVSHSSDNRELAQELASFLEARGARIWIAPRDVRPGMDYSEQLQAAIENCAAFVVLVTEMANKSPYVRAETEMAFSNNKPIFPVRITDIQPAAGLAFFLKIRHWTDAFGPSKSDNLDRLAREVQALSAPAEAPTPPPAVAPAPPPPPAAPVQPMAAMSAPAVPKAPPAPVGPANPAEEEKWRAAVGHNADYYLGRWARMGAKAVSWNWPACLFNLFWFAWRKMWLPMIGVILVLLVIGAIGAATPETPQVTLLLSVAVSFVTGTFGNHLYRKQTAKLVADTEPLGREAQLEALRKRGGTSTTALVIALVLVAALAIANVLLTLSAMRSQVTQPSDVNVVGPVYGDPLETGISGEVDLGNAADDKPE